MDKTFAMRWREVLDTSADLKTTFNKYPFLQDSEQGMERQIRQKYCAKIDLLNAKRV